MSSPYEPLPHINAKAMRAKGKHVRLLLDTPQPVERAPYRGEAHTEPADERTVARHVRSLRLLIGADPRYSAAYHVGRLGLSGRLAAQVLAAYEAGE